MLLVRAGFLALAFSLLQDSPKKVPPELQDKINKAIDKGVKYLKGRLSAPGPASKRPFDEKKPLMAFALIKSGVAKTDPVVKGLVKDALALANAGFASSDKFSQMYLAGIVGMLLAEFEDAESKKALQKVADVIAAAQLPTGSWGYTVSKPDAHDNTSTAQYALLGLQAAANRGCKVPESAFENAARYFVGAQEKGADAAGWGYHDSRNTHGSVTAIGIASLVICRSNLPADHAARKSMDDAIRKGIGWLGKNFSVSEHPGKKPWQNHKDTIWLYYYLYSLERAGVFAGVDDFGAHQWYPEGAEFLVKKQRANGSWEETHEQHEDDDLATCFALLFLARASEGFIKTEPSQKK